MLEVQAWFTVAPLLAASRAYGLSNTAWFLPVVVIGYVIWTVYYFPAFLVLVRVFGYLPPFRGSPLLPMIATSVESFLPTLATSTVLIFVAHIAVHATVAHAGQRSPAVSPGKDELP